MRQPFQLFAVLFLVACPASTPETPDAGNGCIVDNQCDEGYVCFNQVCVFPPTFDAGPARDTGPREAFDTGIAEDGGVDAGASTQEDAGPAVPQDAGPLPSCRSHIDCPIHAYCNVRDQMCVVLPAGRCRDDSVCEIACEIAEGAPMGRCIDCEAPEHCPENHECIGGQCQEIDAGLCQSDDECAAHERCDAQGACVPRNQGGGGGGGGGGAACASDADCPEGQSCLLGMCLDAGGGGGGAGLCTGDQDCPEGQICKGILFQFQCGLPCTEDAEFRDLCDAIGFTCTEDGHCI